MRQLGIALLFLVFTLGALPTWAQVPPTQLNIVVVAGEGAVNNIGQRALRDTSVRVEDENQKPISGAAVVFTLPTEGASGEFSNGSKSITVITDNQGIATAQGMKINEIPGKLQIHINASYRGRTARTNITQFNMAVPGKSVKHSGKKVWIILAVVAAGAGGGIFAATHGSSTPASNPSGPTPPAAIGITPGQGTVGPPPPH
jgi:hypothetical protein